MLRGNFGLVLLLLLLPCEAAISSIRSCDRSVCTTSTASTLRLSCGGQGEVITHVKAASYGDHLPASCPTTGWDDVTAEAAGIDRVANASAFSNTCTSLAVKAIVEKCIGKAVCSIERSTLPPTTACSPAPGGVVLTAAVECGPGGTVPLDSLTLFAVGCIIIIMYAMGITLVPMDLWLVFRQKRVGILIGWASQFGFMPLYSFLVAKLVGVDALTAVGIVLCGSAPGGTTSNLFTYWSKGSVALSIVMSFFSNLCAIFMMPALIALYIQGGGFTSENLKIPYVNIIASLVLLLIPVIAGVTTRVIHERCNCWPFNCRLPLLCCIGGSGACGCFGAFSHKKDAREKLATREEIDGEIESGTGTGTWTTLGHGGVYLMRRSAATAPPTSWEDASDVTKEPYHEQERKMRWLCGAGRDVQCIFDCARGLCAAGETKKLYGAPSLCCCWGVALWLEEEPNTPATSTSAKISSATASAPGAAVELTTVAVDGAREAEGEDDAIEGDAVDEGDGKESDALVFTERIIYGRGQYCYQWTTKIGSAIGGAFLAAAIITGSIDNPDIFDLSRYWHLWLIAASYQPMGTSFGFILSSVFGLGPEDMRAVGIETGVQSYALVISVISTSFTGCQRDQILTFPLIAGLWYSINSLAISFTMRFIIAPFDKYCDRTHSMRCGRRCRCGERVRLDLPELEVADDHPLHPTNMAKHSVHFPPTQVQTQDVAAFVHRPWIETKLFPRA